MRTITVLFAALVLVTSAYGADAPDRSVHFEHPWVPTRYFDYGHSQWRGVKEADFGVFLEEATDRITHHADGSVEHARHWLLRVRDPSSLPTMLYVAERSPLRQTTFTEFDIRWESGGTTRVVGEADLVARSTTPFRDYLTDRVGLFLPMDRSKPGTLRMSVTTHSSPVAGLEALMGGIEFVQPGPPARERTVVIEVPTGTPMQFAQRFFEPRTPVTAVPDGAIDRYTFAFETLLAPGWQDSMPSARQSWPHLVWSNQPSWAALAGILSGVWEPMLEGNEEMTAWAEELTAGAATVHDKAVAVHDAVAEGWDYLGFYPSASGWIPHPATSCWAARIGDCKDKTALMVTLLRAVGVDAWPAVVNAGDDGGAPGAPMPLFNHAIVAVADPDAPDGILFLDSTDAGVGTWPLGSGLADRDALVLRPGQGRLARIPPASADRWLVEETTDITLAADGTATATIALRAQGDAASRRQQSRAGTDPADWTRQLRRHFLTRWPGADLSALEEGPDPEAPGDALRVSTRLSSPHLAQRAGPHVVIRPPWLQRRDPTDIEVDSHRVHPVVLDAHHVRGTIRIALPPGAEVIAVPEPFEVTRDDWEARLTARIADDAVILEAVVHEHPGLMDATLQEARRNFIEAVEAARDQPVILRMGE